MVWFLLIELFLLIMAIVFARFSFPNFSALAIGIMILLATGLAGAQVGGRIYFHLVPYYIYSHKEVQNNNIVCTGFKEDYLYFSNGEKFKKPKNRLLDVATSVSFVFGGGLVFFPGFYLAKRITRRYAPDVYLMFESKPSWDKSRKKQIHM